MAAVSETTPEADPRKLAEEARDRVRFEEEALDLADQVYRVARHMVNSREEAEDLVQEAYARAFRSWKQFTPGTNLRAWLLRILTNLNLDRGRRIQRSPDFQPIEELSRLCVGIHLFVTERCDGCRALKKLRSQDNQ